MDIPVWRRFVGHCFGRTREAASLIAVAGNFEARADDARCQCTRRSAWIGTRDTPWDDFRIHQYGAAQDEDARAAEYFQPAGEGRRDNADEDQELVKQLTAVLNTTFPASALSSTNADSRGPRRGRRARDEITIARSRLSGEPFPVMLVREEDAHNVKLWFISRQT